MLYDTELVWVILTQTNRVPIKSLFGLTKNQVEHLILVQLVLDKMSNTTFIIEAHPPT